MLKTSDMMFKVGHVVHEMECAREVFLLAYDALLNEATTKTVKEARLQSFNGVDILMKAVIENTRAFESELVEERKKEKQNGIG